MDVQAHFENIRDAIRQALDGAASDITAAIAWLTDRELGEALIRAARRGCRVRLALLDDAINRRESSLTERLQAAGCRVYRIPEAGGGGSLHHKFCVIDHDAVITGSYNWTRRASRADENIIVVRGDRALASGYLDAFDALLDKYGHADGATPVDSQQLLRRLRVIHNLLLLDDHVSVTGQLSHLQAARRQPAIAELIQCLQRQDWAGAVKLLDDLLAQGTALIVYQDPESATLRLELRTLEAEVVALSSEQADLEQQINAFALRQHHALGEVLGEYLRLRREVLRRKARDSDDETDRAAEAEAEADYRAYEEDRAALDEAEPMPELDPDEQRELKRLFREASMLCHPDRVAEADRANAAQLFIRLREARQQNDLDTVRRIHRQLREGAPFADPANVLTETDQLRRQIARLRLEIDRLMIAIRQLHESDTYRTLAEIDDWERYFTETRDRLQAECEQLREALDTA